MNAKRSPSRPKSVLLLDIGNSRLKWALQRGPYRTGRGFAASGVIELKQLSRRGAFLLRLLATLDPKLAIEACSVAGVAVEKQLRAMIRRAGLRPARFLRSTHAAAGVRNAYPEPWRLGADRWAALIGARSEFPGRALCLVAVGTAMTIDLLDANGRHRGGNIVPGPRLMIESLLEHTAGIRRRAGGRSAGSRFGKAALFAHDTRNAIASGAVHAAAALIAEALRSARVLLRVTPQLILSGGAADVIGPLLRRRHIREDDLALRGLALLHSERP
ncbi:MAG TPA: type III pantothenate kinase [Steroidobacteraceae bacterium]|jgi:type III pantothenate kinase